MQQKHPLHLSIPISKIDEEERMVYGYATVEELDSSGEIITYDASKKAFGNWIGNIREMHGPVAVGKGVEVEYDDDNKGVWVGAKISESADGENAWTKIKEKVLTGFSIGGKMNSFETKKVDGVERVVITDYDLAEVSVVDNPAVRSATFQIVKRANDGHLQRVEDMKKGARPVAWWEKMFKYSDSQNVIKSGLAVYNKNSMSKNLDIQKNLYQALNLIDLALCLKDYAYWKSWEGEDVDSLKDAVETIKGAASDEISEPENWPDEVNDAIELACKTLNISKAEELSKMADERKQVAKATIGQEERNADAEVVLSAEETGRPLNDTAERAAENDVPVAGTITEDKDGKKEVQPVVHHPDAPQGDGNSNAADDKAVADAAAGVTAAVDPTEDGDGDDTGADKTPGDSAEDQAVAQGKKPSSKQSDQVDEAKGKKKKDASDGSDIEKATPTDDLAKSILSGVESLIAKAVDPLKEEIAVLKGQPVVSKAKGSYVDVNKSDTPDKSAQEKEQADLIKRSEELAADPTAGTPNERIQVAVQLRKMSRANDPKSIAQNEEIRKTFSQSQ